MEKTKATKRPARKGTTIQIRLRPAEKALISRAAELRRTTLSGFILEHACQAAQQVLADQVHFVLPPDRWEAFCQALDAPPKVLPALSKLLSEPNIFEQAR